MNFFTRKPGRLNLYSTDSHLSIISFFVINSYCSSRPFPTKSNFGCNAHLMKDYTQISIITFFNTMDTRKSYWSIFIDASMLKLVDVLKCLTNISAVKCPSLITSSLKLTCETDTFIYLVLYEFCMSHQKMKF